MAGVRITDRDHQLLEFAAKHRLVLAEQAQSLLGATPAAMSTRMGALARAGLLQRHAVFDGQPGCFLITRKGLAAVGSRLPTPRLELRTYRHDVGLAWLWVAARRGAYGELAGIVSEREMRSADAIGERAARGTTPHGVRLGGVGGGGRPRLHYPDLLLIGPGGGRVAVELELTGKTRTRRERILAGYGADPRFDAVMYVVDRPGVARALRASAERVGVSQRVWFQRFRAGPQGASNGSSRVATRAAGRRVDSVVAR